MHDASASAPSCVAWATCLEYYGLADASVLESLRGMLTATYQRLDPLLPAEGVFLSRWRLRLNVTPEELDATRLG